MMNLMLAAFLLPPSTSDVREMSFGLPREAPPAVVDAITAAVANDEELPLTGSYRGEAALMLVFAYHESAFKTCAAGDSGKSLGVFQLQRLPRAVACDPARAAVVWLARAHESYAKCSMNDEDARLAALASGNCGHGRVLSARREKLALEVASR